MARCLVKHRDNFTVYLSYGGRTKWLYSDTAKCRYKAGVAGQLRCPRSKWNWRLSTRNFGVPVVIYEYVGGWRLTWTCLRRQKFRTVDERRVGKPEGKRPLGRPRRRWVDNIKIDLGEIGWDGMDRIDLALDRDQWRGLLWTRRWTFGFLKMLGTSWVAAQLAASQEGLSSVSK
jgi:hypothetical protein